MLFFKKLGNFIISKRFLINLLAICVFWVVLILGVKMYFKSYTHHGELYEVPTLSGNNANDIPELIGDLPLKYEILDSIYEPNLIAGTVVYQNPMPSDSSGVMVKPNRVIKVRVSKRTRLVSVPYVVSKSQRYAEAVLKAKGLRIHTEYVPSIEDQGSVIKQLYKGKKIKEELKVPINSVVTLVVGKRSLGELVPVPNLAGLTIKEAKSRFKNGTTLRLFAVCMGCVTAKDSSNAKVIRQTPVAKDSSMVPKGSTITIFASPKQLSTDSLNN